MSPTLKEKLQLAAITGTDVTLTGAEADALLDLRRERQIGAAAAIAEGAPAGKRVEMFHQVREEQERTEVCAWDLCHRPLSDPAALGCGSPYRHEHRQTCNGRCSPPCLKSPARHVQFVERETDIALKHAATELRLRGAVSMAEGLDRIIALRGGKVPQ